MIHPVVSNRTPHNVVCAAPVHRVLEEVGGVLVRHAQQLEHREAPPGHKGREAGFSLDPVQVAVAEVWARRGGLQGLLHGTKH